MVLFFSAAKPKYEFLKKLPAKMEVFRTKHTVLECFVNNDDCAPKWFKNGKPIKVNYILNTNASCRNAKSIKMC
jgi:hypothetical protein